MVWKKPASSLTLNKDEARRIGMQIWQNECSGKKENLTAWNEGEDFASLGIGHFIWYPQGQTGDFKETFPTLIAFMERQGSIVPTWIKNSNGCPWHSRHQFQQAQKERRMLELREWLFSGMDFQIQFMVNRLNTALPTMIKQLPAKKQSHITQQFHRLANSPAGFYVLIDYLNFKGEGVSNNESYQGHRWGLLQVLNQMKGSEPGSDAIKEFVEAAKYVLNKRIEHAPPDRKEERWKQGWFNRLNTYLHY
jgi:hypothetical protein